MLLYVHRDRTDVLVTGSQPRTATSTFTQLQSSVVTVTSGSMLLDVHRDRTDIFSDGEPRTATSTSTHDTASTRWFDSKKRCTQHWLTHATNFPTVIKILQQYHHHHHHHPHMRIWEKCSSGKRPGTFLPSKSRLQCPCQRGTWAVRGLRGGGRGGWVGGGGGLRAFSVRA